jgi:hypothetical protein
MNCRNKVDIVDSSTIHKNETFIRESLMREGEWNRGRRDGGFDWVGSVLVERMIGSSVHISSSYSYPPFILSSMVVPVFGEEVC